MKTPCQRIESSIIKKFRKEIWRPFVRGMQEFQMVKAGDRVAVCISGGKGFHAVSQVYAGNPAPRERGV